MAVYKCTICGAIFDEEKEGKRITEITECPVCRQPVSKFEKIISDEVPEPAEKVQGSLSYDPEFERHDKTSRYMEEIHEMAVSGKSLDSSMGTRKALTDWDSILLLGAQLNPPPLLDHDPVETRTVIGKNARRPMVLESPVYISHMSFGALSREIKIALAKGSAMAETAMCSGEGGILPEEKAAAYKYP